MGKCFYLLAAVCALLAVGVPVALQSPRTLKLRVAVNMLGWSGLANVVRENAAERMLGKKHTEARTAWQEFVDALAKVDFDYLSPAKGITSTEDIAEGYHALTHIMKAAFSFHVDLDPLHPRFAPIGTRGDMKVLGDNPDSKYHLANLEWGRTYRVWGRIQTEAYVSFTLAEAPCAGCFSNAAIADVNHKSFEYGADGRSFELFIGPERPAGAANYLPLTPSGPGTFVQLITRSYFEHKVSVHLDPTIVPVLGIELHGTALPPPPPLRDDEVMARRLRRATRYIVEHTVEMKMDPEHAPSWFSFMPNTLGPPTHFRGDKEKKNAGGGLGAVDISYSGGSFRIAPDEAMLMEAVIPECIFASVMLWNRYLQTYDFLNRQVSLNRKQMQIGEGGRVRVLISPSRPRAELGYDWLDSEGRPDGRIFWRFILAETAPLQPNTTVLKVADIV